MSAVLYSNWGSSCSYRLRICLNLKQIPHQVKIAAVAFSNMTDEEKDELSPTRFVPILQIDGKTLIETMAVMEYLEESRKEFPLLPHDLMKRAQVRAICNVIVSGIQPLQNTEPLKMINEKFGADEKTCWVEHWINRGFTALEKMLLQSAGKYCVGDEITLADCCLVPQVLNARRFKIDLSPYPIIIRVDEELRNHPAFKKAHPKLQDDFPQELASDSVFM